MKIACSNRKMSGFLNTVLTLHVCNKHEILLIQELGWKRFSDLNGTLSAYVQETTATGLNASVAAC